ncbi:MAG: aminotransferase class V-fold PLP-dependent enzyme [Verrucomicrobia bacterium]|nr:aminotransferase class V-fold PLP-dependent enzyme [Verrucomicrobiota bacterium]
MGKQLAIEGGTKAVKQMGSYPTKIHVDELLELLDLWELPAAARKTMETIIRKSAKEIKGPHLFRYYNPRPSKVEAAEKAFSKFIGTPYCLAVNSCTSALIAAMRALGIGMGDEVIVPAYTFFATAAAVGACNAIPVIADIDDTLTLDPKDVARRITPRTKAIAVVHMLGLPAQMAELKALADKHKIALIEDVAQAAGGSYRGKMLGSIGTIGCFSFDYYKVLNSGEGGFVMTSNEWLHTRAQSWHDCAACWRPNRYAAERREGELFCGENYRMSELQGAVALAQIRKADKIVGGYRMAFRRIMNALNLPAGVKLQRLADPNGTVGTTMVIFMPDAEKTKWATKAMQAEGVPAGGIYDAKIKNWHIYTHWDHIMEQKAVAPDGLPWSGVKPSERPIYAKDMCPQTLDYLGRSVVIGIDSNYTAADCRAIAEGINKVLAKV